MARSAGDRPRPESLHASRALPDSTTCSTGTSAASSTVVSSSRIAENAVVLRMTAGRRRSISRASSEAIGRILEAAHGDGQRRQAFAIERRHQRRHRLVVGRHEIGAIEDDQRGRALVVGIAQHRDRADRDRRPPRLVASQQGSREAQRLAEILGPALAEEAFEQRQRARRHGRHRGEPRIGAVVAGQGREQDAVLARGIGDPLEPVAPVIEAAEAAHDHDLGARHHAVDIEIDRHRMAQPLEAGEPQGRQRPGVALPGGGQRRQVAVGEGQHDHLGRRLAEIDGDVGLLERRKLGGQDVHDQPRISASIPALSRPFSPITTSRPRRASPAAQRRSILMLEACADALHQQAHRLAGDVDEALHAQDVVRRRRLGEAVDHGLRRVEGRQLDDEGVEVVVVVLALDLVMRRPAVEIGFAPWRRGRAARRSAPGRSAPRPP